VAAAERTTGNFNKNTDRIVCLDEATGKVVCKEIAFHGWCA
jgi:hypothetical protein